MHEALKAITDKLGVDITNVYLHRDYNPAELQCFKDMTGSEDPSESPMYDHQFDKIFIRDGFPDYDHVLSHELVHWTGHDSRLGRFTRYQRNACCTKHAYMLEELTAELGRRLLAEKLGIEPINRDYLIVRLAFATGMNPLDAFDIADADAEKAVAYLLAEAEQAKQAA